LDEVNGRGCQRLYETIKSFIPSISSFEALKNTHFHDETQKSQEIH
jgi:hypothetical protein